MSVHHYIDANCFSNKKRTEIRGVQTSVQFCFIILYTWWQVNSFNASRRYVWLNTENTGDEFVLYGWQKCFCLLQNSKSYDTMSMRHNRIKTLIRRCVFSLVKTHAPASYAYGWGVRLCRSNRSSVFFGHALRCVPFFCEGGCGSGNKLLKRHLIWFDQRERWS